MYIICGGIAIWAALTALDLAGVVHLHEDLRKRITPKTFVLVAIENVCWALAAFYIGWGAVAFYFAVTFGMAIFTKVTGTILRWIISRPQFLAKVEIEKGTPDPWAAASKRIDDIESALHIQGLANKRGWWWRLGCPTLLSVGVLLMQVLSA